MRVQRFGMVFFLSILLVACGGGGGGKSGNTDNGTIDGGNPDGGNTGGGNTDGGNTGGGNTDGGNTGGGQTDAVLKGVLTDSPVAGVSYRSEPSQKSGLTNARGEYDYLAGDTVTFTLAGLPLPAVTARGRITPQIIAEEIFSAHPANVVASAALNLAILFQSLDEDGNPDNGISVSGTTTLSESINVDALVDEQSHAFVGLLKQEALPDAAKVPNEKDAKWHFYKSEMMGNWRMHSTDSGSGVKPFDRSNTDRIVLIDSEGNYIRAEYSLSESGSSSSSLYTGYITFEGDTLDLKTFSNERDLKTGMKPGAISNEAVLRGFNLDVTLEGDKLVFTGTRGDNRVKYIYERLPNIKGSLQGVWAELETDYAGIEGTVRNSDGTLNFGKEAVSLFSIFLEERWVHLVLDRAPGGTNCEHNGVYVAEYTAGFVDDGEGRAEQLSINIGKELVNGVWVNPSECGKSVPAGQEFAFHESRKNDTVHVEIDGDDTVLVARNLSSDELHGTFSQVVDETFLHGSWQLIKHVENDTELAILNILPGGKYVLGVRHNPEMSDCGDGVEYGHYTLDDGREALTFGEVIHESIPEIDCGMVGDSESSKTFALSRLDESRLVLHEHNGWDELIFERIENDGFHGTWIVGNQPTAELSQEGTALTLLPNGRYMAAQFNSDYEGCSDDDPQTSCSRTGIEVGAYSLTAAGGFTVTGNEADTNGASGFLNDGEIDAADFPVMLVLGQDGKTLGFDIEDEQCYDATRVEYLDVLSDVCE